MKKNQFEYHRIFTMLYINYSLKVMAKLLTYTKNQGPYYTFQRIILYTLISVETSLSKLLPNKIFHELRHVYQIIDKNSKKNIS